MTISIHPNEFRDRVVQDLGKLVPGNVWSMSIWGSVKVVESPTTFAGQLLGEIANVPGRVFIVGLEGAMQVPSRGSFAELRLNAGRTYFDTTKQGPNADIMIVYDVTDNYQAGYYVFGENEVPIDYPLHISLGHELAHAKQVLANAYTTEEAGEAFAIAVENDLRFANEPPLPKRVGHDGGRKQPPKKAPTQKEVSQPKSGCFVATAAYGSELHPAVCHLREFRESVLRRTRSGDNFFARFYEVYDQASGPVVEAMAADPAVRDLVRQWLVTPIVRYLEIARDFPDLPLEAAGPWAPFLAEVRSGLEDLATAVPLPEDFTSLSARDAAAELAVALRFMIRTPARRKAWLINLRKSGQLPLHPSDVVDVTTIAKFLRDSGRDEVEIGLILDSVPPIQSLGSIVGATGFGNDVDTSATDRSKWIYTVTLRNASTDTTFTNIRACYLGKPGNLDDMGLTVVDNMAPGDVVVFPLCVCPYLMSYFFVGDFSDAVGDGTFYFPYDPNDPDNGDKSIAANPDGCEDSWVWY